MKNFYVAIIVIFCSFVSAFGQCSGDINLYSQAEVNDFANNSCTVIEGNLYLGSSIQNLLGLQSITTIEGNLNIQSYEGSLAGLGNLTSIGGNIDAYTNFDIRNFKGLESLTSIGGGIELTNASSFSEFKGLENLVTIGGALTIAYTDITNFEGLENLQRVEALFIEENFSLTSFKGLENLQSTALLTLVLNPYLTSFEGLGNLTTMERFNVRYSRFTNFEGLENLISIEDTIGEPSYNFYLNQNNFLINFKGLENLTNITGGINVYDQDSLVNFEGLEGLVNFTGEFIVSNNSSLTSLTGLENLNIEESTLVEITNNPNLEYCCPLINFGIIENTENYSINDNAPSCNSFNTILSVCTGIEIQTQAFYDENENGIYDDSEQYLVRDFTLEPNAVYGFVDEVGINYFYLTDIGTYTISYEDDNPLWTIDPTYSNVEFVIQDITAQDTLIYFPLTSIANITSQRIDLSSSITRCNRETNYWLTYSNKGTVTTSGIIELIPDDLTTFISSNPPVDSTSNGKMYWFYDDLYPTHSEKIHITYEMPEVDNLGEIINFEANIKTNEGYAGHRALLSSELICAYDPNDKLNVPSGYGKENYTLFGDTLEYTIRFQNTGNDTASNVEIRDELSELLDLTTFQPISSSHNVETQIDLESRVATFRFTDIYLPDSFINEPASHGFVKYQILGNTGLNENSDIKNTASIYFDENPAIVTNTVNNRMVSELPSLPVVSANPNVLDFGEISLNNPTIEPQILTVSNLGDLPLEINAFEIGNAVFDAGELENLTIEGGKSEEIAIYFKPTTVGEYLSELVLKSNAGDLTINLSGKATMETGLTTFHQTKVQIYPNPSEGRFTLKSEGEIIRNFTIQNSLGELILSRKVNNEQFEIDLTSESKGLYFIAIETDKGIFVDKVIVY